MTAEALNEIFAPDEKVRGEREAGLSNLCNVCIGGWAHAHAHAVRTADPAQPIDRRTFSCCGPCGRHRASFAWTASWWTPSTCTRACGSASPRRSTVRGNCAVWCGVSQVDQKSHLPNRNQPLQPTHVPTSRRMHTAPMPSLAQVSESLHMSPEDAVAKVFQWAEPSGAGGVLLWW